MTYSIRKNVYYHENAWDSNQLLSPILRNTFRISHIVSGLQRVQYDAEHLSEVYS